MNRWAAGLVFFTALSLLMIFGGSPANAASVWDDTVNTVDELELYAENYWNPDWNINCPLDNISTSWAGIIMNSSDTSMTTSFQNALENGRWAVSTADEGFGAQVVRVWWSEDDLEANFIEEAGYRYLRLSSNSDIHYVTIAQAAVADINASSGCDPIAYNYEVNPPTSSLNITGQTIATSNRVFLTSWDITYPPDYEGEEIPTTYTPPTPPLDWVPDIHIVNAVDWKVTLQDRNFNTFDPVPFTCNQGLTPIIQYILTNNETSETLDQGVFSPTIQYEFQLPNYGAETEFKFTGVYYCGDGEDDPTFAYYTDYYFTLNPSGMFVPDTPSCFNEEFPYLDLDGCTAVIENLLNNLTFGAIKFPNWSIQSDGCHTLGTLGDWLQVPSTSRTICPQFSSTVRNIVTPFLTFVLGITIIGALVTKSREDTH